MPFFYAVLSLIFYYLSLPPIGWWPLVFLAPLFWTPLIIRDFSDSPKRFYLKLYGAMLLFWAVSLIWLPLPHWGIWFGWGVLSIYIACWFPIFIAAARIAVRKFHLPVFIAAPILWIGTEWFRFHVLNGLSFSSLQQALYLKPVFLQSAAWSSEHIVGAWIVMVGTFLGMAFFPIGQTGKRQKYLRILSFLCAAVVFTLMGEYGRWTLATVCCTDKNAKPLRAALLQDWEPLHYPVSSESEMKIHRRYVLLSRRAAEQKPDFIVWPEGTFTVPFYSVTDGGYFDGMESIPEPERQKEVQELIAAQSKPFLEWSSELGVPVLVGGMMFEYGANGKPSIYNAAVFRDANGQVDYYAKMQRVLFGEYVPFVEWLPDGFPLKTLCTPISAGKQNKIFSIQGRTFSVSICFESSLPRIYFRRQAQYRKDGSVPDFLLNVSNDGWFRGILEPELHRATYVFRAIENRSWLLAANHGDSSLAVDPAGRIAAMGNRGKTESVFVEFNPPKPPAAGIIRSLSRLIPAFCAVCVVFLLLVQWRISRRQTIGKNE